jgi:S1-C subfamily serine protease
MNLGTLVDLFYSVVPTSSGATALAMRAGLQLGYVATEGPPVEVWTRILDEAALRGRLGALVDRARMEFPYVDWSQAYAAAIHTTAAVGVVGRDVPWHAPDGAFEKVIGSQPTFLPIAFLEVGLRVARAVGRVSTGSGSGTGFMIHDNLMVTNHHVIDSVATAEHSRVEFNLQQSPEGRDLPSELFTFDPRHGFATSPGKGGDDWTLVRVKGDANAKWGAIEAEDARVNAGDYVNIIQHPLGGSKQIALYHNVVAYADSKRIQYLTDTNPGSSGSPVFDSEWRLVALHHMGGWLAEPNGDGKRLHFRNQGVAASVVWEACRAARL